MSLQVLNGENNLFIEAVLRKAEFGRTNNFDLIQDEGYVALREELAKDFPYLSLKDLNEAITLGIKGKLDTYRLRPLNFTRIYQWIEQRAPFSLGYWQYYAPELMAWAEMTGITARVLELIQRAHAQGNQMQRLPGIIRQVVKQTYWPTMDPNYVRSAGLSDEEFATQSENYRRISKDLFPAFAAKYPDFVRANQEPY